MYTRRPPQRVEDYTTANLVLIFVNMIWIFTVIWVQFGILAVVLAGWAINQLINRLQQHKLAVETARHWTRNGLRSDHPDA